MSAAKIDESNDLDLFKSENDAPQKKSTQADESRESESLECKRNNGDYKAVTNAAELSNFVENAIASGTVAFDTETDSLDARNTNLVGFSLSFEDGKGIYVPLILTDTLFQEPLSKISSYTSKKLF